MTGKERAEIRKGANTLTAIIQIGKDGIAENLIQTVDGALRKRGLIKLSVLESCELTAKEAAGLLAEATNAEIIQCIGRKLVLYREPEEDEKN